MASFGQLAAEFRLPNVASHQVVWLTVWGILAPCQIASTAPCAQPYSSPRVRNFRLFLTRQFISQVGNWLTLVAQVLLVLRLTDNSGVAVGVLTAFDNPARRAFVVEMVPQDKGAERRQPEQRADD